MIFPPPNRPHPPSRLAVLFLLAGLALPALAEDMRVKVEAAYLFHLTKFTEWPSLPAGEFRVCIQDAQALGGMMADLAGRPVRERPLKLEVDDIGDPSACQILFIGRDDKRLADTLRRVRGAAVLTVSDMADFTRKGGMVGFYFEGGKIKLEVNPEAARAANLRFSAKLLELARIVARP